MALKIRNKINPNFSMSSMTDIVFLLLIFFMVTSTLINPNALKLLLPQSKNQTAAKPTTSVSIDKNFNLYVETIPILYSQLEEYLQNELADITEPTISLYVDKSVPMEQVVKIMNIAKNNKYKLILATSAK